MIFVILPAIVATVPTTEVGIVSLYRPWKRSRFVPFARYPGAPNRKPSPDDRVCAHRTHDFGTILRLTRKNGRSARCVVLDRGPYGYCKPSKGKRDRRCKAGFRWVVRVRRPEPGGYYRGVVDATPQVHKKLRSSGWVEVRVKVVK